MPKFAETPPVTIVQLDGFEFWHGSGRITVRNSANIYRMTSVLIGNLPPDADIDRIIEEMGKKVTTVQIGN